MRERGGGGVRSEMDNRGGSECRKRGMYEWSFAYINWWGGGVVPRTSANEGLW